LGFISSLFDPSKSTGYQASGTNILSPTSVGQANTAYDQTQQGLNYQNAFLQALQGQNAIQNQNKLTGTLQDMVQGGGPNPALAQFNRTQGQNIAGTSAAIAGARGAQANPAAAARTIASLGADANMKAATDASSLKQQQQLAAIGALGGQLNNQVTGLGTAGKDYSASAQQLQSNLLNSIAQTNQANVGMQSNMNTANAQIAAVNAGNVGKGVMSGIGGLGQGLITAALGATGGRVKHNQIGHNPPRYANGGGVKAPQLDFSDRLSQNMKDAFTPTKEQKEDSMHEFGYGLGSALGRGVKGLFGPSSETLPASNMPESTPNPLAQPKIGVPEEQQTMKAAHGGKVPAMVSPGEKYLSPHQAQSVLQGKENPLNGKTFHGGKAKVKGDSYENDTIPVTLEEGGCVIPRSVLQSDQPMKNAIKFVHEHMRKMAKGGKVEHKEPVHKETEHHIVPKEVAIEVLRKPHFLFSASNPHVEPEVSMTPDQVLKALQEQGYTAEHAQGKYNDEEPSIMVHNISPEHAGHLMKLAKRLGQESAIYSSGGRHEAHYLNGPKTGMVAHGEGTEVHEHEPENFYTKTKNGLIFSHNIDWDNPRPRK
jgi:hypothetical protein